MHDRAEQLAAEIIGLAGTHGHGCYELLVSALRELGGDPDLHERVALEMDAVAGVGAPGSFELLLDELRARYPSALELDDFIARGKRKASLKLGKPFC
jgi:hypothetical protein